MSPSPISPDVRLTIGRFARLTGLSARTLRKYDGLGLFRPAAFVSEEVVTQDNARWAPDYPKLTWGAQSHLAPVLNVWPQYELIMKGKYSPAADQLQPICEGEVAVLNERLDELAGVLEGLTPQVEALQ